ncbi:MAG: alpha-amylase family glycosyl hydrolase [Candidatus Kryptoniota bacterium]
MTRFYHEFHVSKKSRDRYGLDESFFSITGDVIFANFRQAQLFSELVNRARLTQHAPVHGTESEVRASEINAMGLLHEIYHYIIDLYIRNVDPAAFFKCETALIEKLGKSATHTVQKKFLTEFPPISIYKGELTVDEYLGKGQPGFPNTHSVLIELLLLWLENRNPSFKPISDLIDDADLRKSVSYEDAIKIIDFFFEEEPPFGPQNQPLPKMLLTPIQHSPGLIMEQLQFIAKTWKGLLENSPYLKKLLSGIDFIKEEGKYFEILAQAQAEKSKLPFILPGKPDTGIFREIPQVLSFSGSPFFDEPERFSTDLNWMPNVVLIAKNTHVWLHQLSRKYARSITRLDQIPSEELQLLATRGFTGLWLIGLWKRSYASQKIKNLSGNPDAIASAYSLNSYDVAEDLGGNEAFYHLRDQCAQYGIRLASDMVPNHMGIDSQWVIEHPDWFLQINYPPFPNYSFNGPDLSNDDRVAIIIEDKYWTKQDAAVVFKRIDRWTGDVRYIYHGNDGTHMPWNDTAQLNFLKSEVREAVIQTILHVARMTPIIRFDAAMVLTRKHYQRLWFPEPGTGGAIPSRAAFSMTKEEFDTKMPEEFWREVVDRVQSEVPDTLLLAEAFWLMEGYFVRNLGMHRVYNSAFMNMLKREENANYRKVVKNVLEYNPQILKRFVNFMNNPDEETALAQFGKDDKYFGVCVMMCTMPGLPMFGHGQVEGFSEKYGMEFKRAYLDEQVDEQLVKRHEREIFPLLKKRYLFSEVDNFFFYDFFTHEGYVNEDVFAYSNQSGFERVLVVYNNRYSFAAGWVRSSVGYLNTKSGKLVQTSLADALGLENRNDSSVVFKDMITGMEFIRNVSDIFTKGLYIELGAYKYHVFYDFHQISGLSQFSEYIGGRGVESIDRELHRYLLQDVWNSFERLIRRTGVLIENRDAEQFDKEEIEKLFDNFVNAACAHLNVNRKKVSEVHIGYLKTLIKSSARPTAFLTELLSELDENFDADYRESLHLLMMTWCSISDLCLECGGLSPLKAIDELDLLDSIKQLFKRTGGEVYLELIRCLLSNDVTAILKEPEFLNAFSKSLNVRGVLNFMNVNEYNGILWFNKERWNQYTAAFAAIYMLRVLSEGEQGSTPNQIHDANRYLSDVKRLIRIADEVKYQLIIAIEKIKMLSDR